MILDRENKGEEIGMWEMMHLFYSVFTALFL